MPVPRIGPERDPPGGLFLNGWVHKYLPKDTGLSGPVPALNIADLAKKTASTAWPHPYRTRTPGSNDRPVRCSSSR